MARNPELEALIAKSPDDPSNYLVYADWLIGQNDPRGELISVETKLEGAPDDAALRDRAKALHDEHDKTWLPELKDGFGCTWRRGFLHEVTLGTDDSSATHNDLYQTLRPLPVAQFLHSLRFGGFEDEDADSEVTWDSAVEAMIEYGVPSTLRRLTFDRGDYWDISWTFLNTLEPLYERVPDLERLEIRLGHMDLGAINLPNLREFSVYTGGFSGENMKSVLGAKWPKLERLVLRFGGNEDYGGTTAASDVLPLLDGKTIPHVKHLALANSAFIDELLPALVKSPVLKQLTSLDLSMGLMSDAGAAVILEHADAFKHLDELDLHRNYLTAPVVASLAKVAKSVIAHDQEDGDYRYCQIGE